MNDVEKNLILFSGVAMLLLALSRQGQIVISEIGDNIVSGLTRGERNNNPGNIRPSTSYTWQGQTGIDSGSMGQYVIFSSPEYGIRAIAKDLMTKFGRGLDTVEKIINVYAPPFENITGSYVNAVTVALGLSSAHTKINLFDRNTLTKFVTAIIKHENGRVSYTSKQISDGISMALGD